MELIKQVERFGKGVKGKKEFLRFLDGERLTYKEAVLAKCFTCMGYYADGGQDCGVESCPLHPYQPRRRD